MRYLSGKNIQDLREGYLGTIEQLDNLLLDILQSLTPKLKTPKARNYCTYGLARRTSGIKKCLERFYQIFEHECDGTEISDDERFEETAFLSYFLVSISGGMDNLARIIVEEQGLNLKPLQISLLSDKVRPKLASDLNTELTKYETWLKHLKSFRDPVAHRIPPYVVPHIEFTNGGKTFDSYYTHDFDDSPTVPLHPQVIADARTFYEIIRVGVETFPR